MDSEVDKVDVSPEDYTVLVKNIPVKMSEGNDDYDKDLKEFLETHVLEKRVSISKMNLAYNVSPITALSS